MFRLCLLMITLAASSLAAQETADLVLVNGNIITLDDLNPKASAMAVKEGRILLVGGDAEAENFVGKGTQLIDLNGALTIPGFIDGHAHIKGIGFSALNLRLNDVSNWDQVIRMVTEAAEGAKPGEWILGRGWHQEKWDKTPAGAVAGYPTHDALSAVSPNNPVLLRHASGHGLFANAAAMAAAGVTDKTANPEGGEIVRDAKGRAIGIFLENGEKLINDAYKAYESKLTPAQWTDLRKKEITTGIQECLSKGVTTLHDAGADPKIIKLYRQMAEERRLGVRLWVMAFGKNEELAKALPDLVMKDYGGSHLTVGGIKCYIDGALGSRGALLLAPYADKKDTSGERVTSMADLRGAADLALKHNLQLCVHAIGDRGNREVLDLYEAALKGDKSKRWRIEHAQHLDPADVPRFAKLGVIASMQGVHCTSDAVFVPKRLGDKRAAEGAYVWRKLLDSGAMVTNGTDAPVEDVDPLPGYYAMVTRKPKGKSAFYPNQKLTRMEALRAYTIDNARAAFQEDDKGTLAPGKLADITVLSKDITKIPAAEILKTKVLYTIVDGVVRYEAH